MITKRALSIVRSVSEDTGVDASAILSDARDRNTAHARQVVFARIRAEIKMSNRRPPSYPMIGSWFGVHHTTVVKGEQSAYEREIKMWTPELKETARQLKSSGVSNEEIAKAVGKTKNAVALFLHRETNRDPDAKSSKRPPELSESEIAYAVSARKQGKSFCNIGREMHRDPSTVSKHLRAMGFGNIVHTWTADEDETLKSMYLAGEALGDIATVLKVTNSSVSNRVCSLGLSRPKQVRPKKKRDPDPMLSNITPRESGSWDSRTFLPWPQWRQWKQEQRKQMQQERAA